MKTTTHTKATYTAKKFVLRLPPNIHEKILLIAKHHRRSMNAEIIYHLDKILPLYPTPKQSIARDEPLSDEQYFIKLLQSLSSEERTTILDLLEGFKSHSMID